MRGKLAITLLVAVCLVAAVAVAGSRGGPSAGAAVLVLMLGGIALIQVGAHDPVDRS